MPPADDAEARAGADDAEASTATVSAIADSAAPLPVIEESTAPAPVGEEVSTASIPAIADSVAPLPVVEESTAPAPTDEEESAAPGPAAEESAPATPAMEARLLDEAAEQALPAVRLDTPPAATTAATLPEIDAAVPPPAEEEETGEPEPAPIEAPELPAPPLDATPVVEDAAPAPAEAAAAPADAPPAPAADTPPTAEDADEAGAPPSLSPIAAAEEPAPAAPLSDGAIIAVNESLTDEQAGSTVGAIPDEETAGTDIPASESNPAPTTPNSSPAGPDLAAHIEALTPPATKENAMAPSYKEDDDEARRFEFDWEREGLPDYLKPFLADENSAPAPTTPPGSGFNAPSDPGLPDWLGGGAAASQGAGAGGPSFGVPPTPPATAGAGNLDQEGLPDWSRGSGAAATPPPASNLDQEGLPSWLQMGGGGTEFARAHPVQFRQHGSRGLAGLAATRHAARPRTRAAGRRPG